MVIPKGASFKDMIQLKGKSDIGDKINTQIIQPLVEANQRLARTDFPDFNDANKLGEGKVLHGPEGHPFAATPQAVPASCSGRGFRCY